MQSFNNTLLSVTYSEASLKYQALSLASQLNLPLISPDKAKDHIALLLTPDYLGIWMPTESKQPFTINFLSTAWGYRRRQATLRNELLAKAIGISPAKNPRVIDATVGLGSDAFLLATLGYEILAIEKSPIVYALLNDALERAKRDKNLVKVVNRITLIQADAFYFLTKSSADIIYLDPMFPVKQKSAKQKKEMRFLQYVLGSENNDAKQLLNLALTCARQRVVIKRPRLAEHLSLKKPTFTLTGQSSRFDVYLT